MTHHVLQLAQLFVLHVFSKHCILSHVTSDCGTEFVSLFFLFTWNDTWYWAALHFMISPKGDGQTEWINQTLEQYLWVYCNYQQATGPNSSLAESTYNNTLSATTSITPIFHQQGYHPTSPFTLNATLHWHVPSFHHWPQTSCTNNFSCTLPKLNANTRHPPIPDEFPLQNKISSQSLC